MFTVFSKHAIVSFTARTIYIPLALISCPECAMAESTSILPHVIQGPNRSSLRA